MSYSSGTITSATPASDLLSTLESLLTAHGSWSYVQQVTLSGNNYRVWKSNGSGTGANSFGQDFYVIFRADTAANNVLACVAESFITSSGNVVRPVAGKNSSSPLNANGSFGNETTGIALNDSSLPYVYVQTPTGGFPYYISITANRICLASGSNTAFYVGLFDSLLPAEPFPLCMSCTYSIRPFSQGDSGASRQPGKAAGNTDTYNFCHRLYTWTTTSGNTQTVDVAFGAPLASRVLLAPYSQNASQYGYARGLLYDCFYLPDGSTATRNGDTMSVGSDAYVKMMFGTSQLSAGVWVNTAV